MVIDMLLGIVFISILLHIILAMALKRRLSNNRLLLQELYGEMQYVAMGFSKTHNVNSLKIKYIIPGVGWCIVKGFNYVLLVLAQLCILMAIAAIGGFIIIGIDIVIRYI